MIKKVKKIISVFLLTAVFSTLFCVNAGAFRGNNYGSGYRFDAAVLRLTEGSNEPFDWEVVTGAGDKTVGLMSAQEVDIINRYGGVISFETDLSGIKSEHIKSSEFGVLAEFSFLTNSWKWYSCLVNAIAQPVITAEELLKYADIPDSEKVTAIIVREKDIYNRLWLDKDPDYSKLFLNTNFIKGVRVVNTDKKGWVSVERIRCKGQKSDVRKFYVEKSGSVTVKSCTIGGVRYKFDKNGICGGKYTGWTESSAGRRYWKNGVMYKNKWATAKDGSKYYLGRNGYAVTGTAVIKGKVYLFDKKGKCLGLV